MNKHFKILLVFIGLIGLFTSCENDGMKVVMLDNPIAPTLTTVPDLTLQRTAGNDTLTFNGTAVDPGFQASANYFLEACASGTDFADPVTLFSGVQADVMKVKVSDLNTALLKKFPADATTSVDLRLRANLVVDAGTGALGTTSKPLTYISDVKTVNVTPYGYPRLNLINSGIDQKIESVLGDGVYSGFVKLNVNNPFTLSDPDTNTSYGDAGGALAVDGNPIAVPSDPGSGWYEMTADVNALTYKLDPYMIGLVGSATPNGWDAPDQKMDYDAKTGTWNITIDLVDGDIKFRLNDGWAWNLGGTPDNLVHNGDNIAVTAGNYTISLTITNATPVGSETGTYTIVKNN
ncbi:SusE domain-containing protein [Prolixibacter denitrificans]|uniref:Uncharacterized protein DUF5019 n=1 Tax=Prolixibacter denitrificans TaxID=1541063 RepID=A0A2P8CHI0_9BACT|nr:SusE domain-containing protein [Prolixibacter denitrificans]PSK84437.1 uncharacterized protein DUF5019 [Prolixibacter denitrificans]GET20611.1 hypothetical protein JCM18694_08570 [Prolixibacter denitrificans]